MPQYNYCWRQTHAYTQTHMYTHSIHARRLTSTRIHTYTHQKGKLTSKLLSLVKRLLCMHISCPQCKGHTQQVRLWLQVRLIVSNSCIQLNPTSCGSLMSRHTSCSTGSNTGSMSQSTSSGAPRTVTCWTQPVTWPPDRERVARTIKLNSTTHYSKLQTQNNIIGLRRHGHKGAMEHAVML